MSSKQRGFSLTQQLLALTAVFGALMVYWAVERPQAFNDVYQVTKNIHLTTPNK